VPRRTNAVQERDDPLDDCDSGQEVEKCHRKRVVPLLKFIGSVKAR
jgi:hypothetical protein